MAPESQSPSASSTLLPFLGPRSRRGSLASITSTKGRIDKDILAQALDSIHTSASKSETLTSFHDFDGGPIPQSGPKELVSSGVTGLYDKLKRGFNVGTPVKEGKSRPKSNGSKESIEIESVLSNVSRKANGLRLKSPAADSASIVSSKSVTASPLLANFTSSGTQPGPHANESKPDAQRKSAEQVENRVPLSVDTKLVSQDQASEDKRPRAVQDSPTQDDLDRARSAIVDDDHSTNATQALARVLSHHEVHFGDKLKHHLTLNIGVDNENAVDDSDSVRDASRSPSVDPVSRTDDAANTAESKRSTNEPPFQNASLRPSMTHIGASHLPGFQPSREPSTDGASLSSTHTVSNRRALDPSVSLNSALGRRRTARKPAPAPAQPGPLEHVPSHLKRRVISKAFWMKDENAKDCFYCGQTFSTFRRKHHCRTCGQIFDAQCTNLVPGRPFGQPGTIRLCNPCEAMIYGSDDDSTVFSDDGSEYPRSPMIRRGTGDSDDFPGRMDGINENDGDFVAEVTTPSIGIPASRRNREAKRRSAVIEFDAGPTLTRPTSSHSLISLSRRPRSSSHRRHQSRQQTLRNLRIPAEERVPFHPGSADDPEKKMDPSSLS